jgi:hypothetical protein
VDKLEEMRREMPATPTSRVYIAYLTDNEATALETMEQVADKGYKLVKDVAGRLRPEAGTRLFEVTVDSRASLAHPLSCPVLQFPSDW